MLGVSLAVIIARAVTLLVAFTIHELAHAVSADRLGDSTPRRMGRITLNPLAHLDPVGTFMLLIAGFGWAKPVMVNPYNMRGNPRSMMAVVALSLPELILLRRVLRVPLLVTYVAVVAAGIVAVGYLFNLLLA